MKKRWFPFVHIALFGFAAALAVGSQRVVFATDPTPADAGTTPTLVLKSAPYQPIAGQPATLTVSLSGIKPAADGSNALTGLFLVRGDLGEMYYEQPAAVSEKDPTLQDTFTFGSGGDWKVFGETGADVEDLEETAPVKLSVNGARAIHSPLMPQPFPVVVHSGGGIGGGAAGYTLTLKQPTRLVANTDGKGPDLMFTLVDGQGLPVADTDLWRGAIAHLILIDREGTTLLHATPDTSDPRTGRSSTLIFPTHIPKAGVWKGWVLFRRTGQTVSLPFVVRVLER